MIDTGIKISVITPSYNQGKYIEQTILSVINQKYKNFEYIIIDGGSNDNTIDIIKKYENHITFWTTQKDNGQAHAINKGLNIASGDIVCWINSDDMLCDDTLQFVAEFFTNNPQVDLIYGNVIQMYQDNTDKNYVYIPNEFHPVDFLSRVAIHQPAVFWRKKLHEQIGMLDERLHFLMDYDLWIRIFFNFNTCRVNKTLAKFRIHHDAKTYLFSEPIYLEQRFIISKFLNSINLNSSDYINLLKKLNIYNNIYNEKYIINKTNLLDKLILHKIFENYIYNCVLQQYTLCRISSVNKLFFAILKETLINTPLKISLFSIFIKNLMFVRFFKKWMK